MELHTLHITHLYQIWVYRTYPDILSPVPTKRATMGFLVLWSFDFSTLSGMQPGLALPYESGSRTNNPEIRMEINQAAVTCFTLGGEHRWTTLQGFDPWNPYGNHIPFRGPIPNTVIEAVLLQRLWRGVRLVIGSLVRVTARLTAPRNSMEKDVHF
jgi:hypothetical protein